MMYTFFALPQKKVDAYIASRRELLALVKGMSSKDIESGKAEIIKSASINDIPQALERNNNALYSVIDGIAYIPIEGFLCQEVDICTLWFGGTVTTYPFIRAAIAAAEEDSSVKVIALMHDSGGGLVDGVDQTAQAILGAKKQVFSFSTNLTASADYWLASQTDHFVSVTESGFFGSIGVAVSYIDRSEARKKDGIQVKTMTSTPASKKRPDLLTEEGQSVIIKELDDIHNVFVKSIMAGRPQLTVEKINATQGGVLIASDAVKQNLIDGIIKESEIADYIKDNLNSTRKKRETNPAGMAGNKTEVNMDLKEMLNQNPAAKAEHEKALKENYNAGVSAEKKRQLEIVEKLKPFMESETYNQSGAFRKAAVRVLDGGMSYDAFDAAITMMDAQAEKEKSDSAKKETAEIPDTTGENIPSGAATGVVKTPADLKAVIDADKKLFGTGA